MNTVKRFKLINDGGASNDSSGDVYDSLCEQGFEFNSNIQITKAFNDARGSYSKTLKRRGNMEHTPGKWYYNKLITSFQIYGADGNELGRVEKEADARLIIQAPAMYEVCRLLAGKMYDDTTGRTVIQLIESILEKLEE